MYVCVDTPMRPSSSSPQWPMALWRHASYGWPVVEFMHLKFVEMKKFVYHVSPQITELIRKYLSSIQIFEKIIDKDSFA